MANCIDCDNTESYLHPGLSVNKSDPLLIVLLSCFGFGNLISMYLELYVD